METKSIPTPHTQVKNRRRCFDGFIECVVCRQPVEEKGHKLWVWQHGGGALIVSKEEGERLNAAGEEGGDLGMQPVGAGCIKKHPQIKPFLL